MNPLQAVDLNQEGASVWVALATLLSVIATSLFQAYRESRNHKWDEQRRLRIAAELQAQVEATALTLRQEAAAVAFAVKAQVEVEARAVKQQVEAGALSVKQQMEATEATVKQQAVAHAVQVARALRENIAITERAVAEAQNAYQEANHSKKKIEEIRGRFDEVLRLAALQREQQVDHIQETTDDTNEIVRASLAADADAKAARE